MTAIDIAFYSSCTVTFIIILQVVYRLYFHPLAKYPGPFLARCTSWYGAYQSYTGNIHLDVQRCHEKYGDVVRYKPNGLIVNTVEGLQDIYMHPSKTQKARGYIGFRNGKPEVSIINALDREEHAPRRKMLSRAFSTVALKKYEPVIYRTAKVFGDTLLASPESSEKARSWGPGLNIGHISSYFTFDIMSNIVFYSPQNMMTETHARPILETIDNCMLMAGMEVIQPRLVDYRNLRTYLAPRLTKKILNLGERIWPLVMGRIELEKKQHVDDIFGDLIGQQGKEGSGLTNEELMADALVMVIAGTDTSSVAISGFFFYIARHPEVYKRLAAEIRSTFSSLEEIAPGPRLTSCSYLLACIDEALRLAPPVAAPLWREMRMQESIAGNVLPKGVDVATCCYAIQRNPAYFPDPDEFIPERWLPDNQSEEALKLAKRAFIPFSLGSRGCLGKNIAYMELTTALAQIMFRADWKRAEGPMGTIGETRSGAKGAVNFEIKGHFTSEKHGPYIQFIPRDLDEQVSA
ncbi:cytochrome P450 [Alternaria alternata]|uniref:Cytochrome P450 n=2 Tax=Alternaria alternata complex TaxID=187734 RepID=A0A177E0H0_ALTAL|nr:cytochrome P450 [Alternaria alternata]KAH6841573.1 cytochrome P450 [Alternaria alternata]OAG25474.1 cytochrome P450 [Alternaria alternata]RYN62267.1 hypothetical protein AA0114_g156 [Alternaria tenuissima]